MKKTFIILVWWWYLINLSSTMTPKIEAVGPFKSKEECSEKKAEVENAYNNTQILKGYSIAKSNLLTKMFMETNVSDCLAKGGE